MHMGSFTILLILGMSLIGAFGDGTNDDSQAFLDEWNEICGSSNDTASLTIPNDTFLFKQVSFNGPCKPNTINFQINGEIIAPNTTDWIEASVAWISFINVNGLIVSGNGKIDAQGSAWWTQFDSAIDRPVAMQFRNCENLKLNGLTHVNSARNHISIDDCNVVSISNLQIYAPETSPNTDGIDISSSTNVDIRDSIIGTGDDCISIGDQISNINITNITCGPAHGISIGSLGKDGVFAKVENIYVMDSSFIGTQNGARIKTWQGGSGYARNIHFSGINITNTDNPIIIDQYYCNGGHNCKNTTSAVEVSQVSFTGVVGTSARETAIKLSCSESVGCKNVIINDVTILPADPKDEVVAYCVNAHGKYEDTVPPLNNCLLP